MTEAPDPRVELVRRTAELARLDLTPAETGELANQLERILSAFQALSEANVEGIEPLIGPAELVDVLREDRAAPGLEREELLARAPRREGEFFGVPKTIGGAGGAR